jgi:hypothetical protein
MTRARGWCAVGHADLKAENDVCALLLHGEAAPEQLLPLEPKHHHSRLHGLIHEAVAEIVAHADAITVDSVAAEVRRRGLNGNLERDLGEILACTPDLTPTNRARLIARVIELWHRRQASREIVLAAQVWEAEALLSVLPRCSCGVLAEFRNGPRRLCSICAAVAEGGCQQLPHVPLMLRLEDALSPFLPVPGGHG